MGRGGMGDVRDLPNRLAEATVSSDQERQCNLDSTSDCHHVEWLEVTFRVASSS